MRGNAGSQDLAEASRFTQPRITRTHNGLSSVGDGELIEDRIDVIANGFGPYRQLACDRCIVEAASDQFQNLAFALRKFDERLASRNPISAPPVDEPVDFSQKLLPRRLVLQKDVIAALQRHKFSADN